MGVVYNTLKANGYTYRSTKGKGVVRRVYPEYDVYGVVEVYCRVLGKKHGKTWRFYLGRAYAWTTTRVTDSYNVVRLVGISDDAQDLFAVSSEPLGGKRETLG